MKKETSSGTRTCNSRILSLLYRTQIRGQRGQRGSVILSRPIKRKREGRRGFRVGDKVEQWRAWDRMMEGREQKNRVSEVDKVKDAECLEEV